MGLVILCLLISLLAARLSAFVSQCLNPNAAIHENHLDQPTPARTNSLYGGRVKHDADRSAERLSRERVGELGADNAGVAWRKRHVSIFASLLLAIAGEVVVFTMGPGDLAPDHPDLGAADLLLSPVDIGDLLAKVEARITVSDG